MPLKKTSVQLDSEMIEEALKVYPGLTFSEIVRLAVDYTIKRKPRVIKKEYVLED